MKRWFLVLLAWALGGCATYEPKPLNPAAAEARFMAGSLSDPGLNSYLMANLPGQHSASDDWDLKRLTLVGFYYSPELAVARSQVAVADAAIITAAMRPNPQVALGGVGTPSVAPNFAPWGIGLADFQFQIETAGKRDLRILGAQRRADAARLRMGEMAWRIRGRIRAAFVDHLFALKENELLHDERDAMLLRTELVRERLNAGEASAPEATAALSALSAVNVAARQADGRVLETRGALAAALGLPPGALDGVPMAWPSAEDPATQEPFDEAAIRRLALTNRLDLRAALVDYAAAEAALRLEIAKQYPDIYLGGGYNWEAGDNLFQLAPLINLPILNRNEGPIAEAKARRDEAAARFVALQARVISDSAAAFVRYRAALAQLREADRTVDLQRAALESIRRAVSVGEQDRLALADVEVRSFALRHTRLDMLRAARVALGALEDACERPLAKDDLGSFAFPSQPVMTNPGNGQGA